MQISPGEVKELVSTSIRYCPLSRGPQRYSGEFSRVLVEQPIGLPTYVVVLREWYWPWCCRGAFHCTGFSPMSVREAPTKTAKEFGRWVRAHVERMDRELHFFLRERHPYLLKPKYLLPAGSLPKGAAR